MVQIFAILPNALLSRRGALFPLAPVLFGSGVGIFFTLGSEPDLLLRLAVGAGLLASFLGWRMGPGWGTVFIACALIALGFGWAGARTHWVSAPVLEGRYYGPVQGRVIAIDRSASNAVRLKLDQVVLNDLSPLKTPAYVRVALHGDQSHFVPVPGVTVALTGHLAPPGGPVEPGGFDFQRHSWFLRLGGVGYTRTPVMVLKPATQELRIYSLRQEITQGLRDRIGGNTGAVAAAIVTGDRSGISNEVLEQLRATNLAHLLAISGLHMGLLASVVFAAIRGGLALYPALSMRVPAKAIAAVVALIAAASYLVLSGGGIATRRAFVMVSVALIAMLLGRRALSLRAVALAALIVLTLAPEALVSPGFQMSFSATTALIFVFGLVRDHGGLGPKWLRPVAAVVLSSIVAGAATAPYSAAHFNAVSRYGLLANLLAVPVMGSVVAPAAVLSGVLAPFGLEGWSLWVMGQGLDWILWVSQWISGWEDPVRRVPQPSFWVLPVFSLGVLWVLLWSGRARWIGALPVLVAIWGWGTVERPLVLIDAGGGLVGVMTQEGRALSKSRGAGFVASVWLENDGGGASQEASAEKWGTDREVEGLIIRHVTGVKTVAQLTCTQSELVVVNARPAAGLPCQVIGPDVLKTTGSMAMYAGGDWRTVRQHSGDRIWTPWGSRDQ